MTPDFGALRCQVPLGPVGEGPLSGVRIMVKDNVDIAGLPTTAGSLALASSMPHEDAEIITRLRAAGAVIVAKTNLTELANFMTTGMPSGYSSLGGQVLNPYDTSYTPSGSSSGSATAVALGLCVSAVGTETDGSITSPADHQSLVGMKPTHGLVSGAGIFPIASSQDTAGPMARTVADAADLLGGMCDLTVTLDASSLQGKRLACVPDVTGATREVLQRCGAEVVDVTMPELAHDNELYVLHYEFARDVAVYLAGCDGPMRSLRDIAEWNLAHPEVALKFRQVQVDAALDIDHAASLATYEKARADDLAETTSGLERAMDGCDALVFPGAEGCGWAARAGWPSIVIPNGYGDEDRRPVGVMLVSRPWTDAALLSLAHAYEQATLLRREPWEINPAAFR